MAPNDMVYKTIIGCPDALTYKAIVELYQHLFEDADEVFFKKRFQEFQTVSVLAYYEASLVGFKVGYAKDNTLFYSWIGGVSIQYRRRGIAQCLLNTLEKFATKKGYKTLQTKSMNRFKHMMILNLKNGFDITKVYTNTKSQTKIVFEKSLTNR